MIWSLTIPTGSRLREPVDEIILPADISETPVPSFEQIRQFLMIDPHQPQNRGMDVVNMDLVFDSAKPELIRLADGFSAFDAAPRHPGCETVGVVIAAIAPLHHGGAAKFTRPNN